MYRNSGSLKMTIINLDDMWKGGNNCSKIADDNFKYNSTNENCLISIYFIEIGWLRYDGREVIIGLHN